MNQPKYIEAIEYRVGTAYNLGNIGLAYAQEGKYDSAQQYMQEAIVILEELGDKYPITVYDIEFADIYQKRGDLREAIKYAKNSLDVSEGIGS